MRPKRLWGKVVIVVSSLFLLIFAVPGALMLAAAGCFWAILRKAQTCLAEMEEADAADELPADRRAAMK